ncbi:hypothetical protein [Streptomyces similanensis]|uniref:Uncharacterized protein n=1 Tax=Streptomyces similanensis TaxID=1274988 RepID=A0ABP9KGF9_9ACTN
MTPTPKSARQRSRKNRGYDGTRNGSQVRVTGKWADRPDRPASRSTSDKAEARRIAREWAAQGAYVIAEKASGFLWRPWFELDGPALLAQQAAAEESQRAWARRVAREDDDPEAAAAARAAREHDHLARLMTRPPVPRDATGRVTARHTTGGRP